MPDLKCIAAAILLSLTACSAQYLPSKPPPIADSLGSADYVLGYTNTVIYRRFPVSLLQSNISAAVKFPYTAITNAPWLTNAQAGVVLYDLILSNSSAFATSLGIYGVSGPGGALNVLNGNINVYNGQYTGNGAGLTNLTASAGTATRLVATNSILDRTIDMTAITNVWDDVVFEPASVNPVGIAGGATLVETSGQSGDQMALVFAANKLMLVAAQMPHTWVSGSTIYPHMHFEPQSANAITNVWKIDYSVSDIGGTFPAVTHVTNQITIADGSQWKHVLQNLPTNGISMSGKSYSSVVRLRYTLLSTTESMHLISFDVHYRYGGSPVSFNP